MLTRAQERLRRQIRATCADGVHELECGCIVEIKGAIDRINAVFLAGVRLERNEPH